MSDKKERELTEGQIAFLDALFLPEVGGDYRKAMRHAGYSDNYQVSNIISSLSEEIKDRANKIILMNAPKAAVKMGELLDNPSMMAGSNLLKVAQDVLDRSGVTKKSEPTLSDLRAPGGVILLPPKGSVEVKFYSEDKEE